ncbi:uncharacterized protein LOC124531980 [Vanessa cardui]|uniref:uncharacterized protein LOC124531977 n=1 Tax=Vanessa cardui TaxID=171605 RepID=UPI001F12BB53|nr:uncharacterized protein LOC124531977 [Vanessa cardui]XP_046962540.1 uncharacterized protein LOC124531980 [Vanessa cardui]
MLRHVVICHVFIIIQVIYLTAHETPKNYGEFTLKIINFHICKGPKRIDCTNITSRIHNETNLILNFEIKKNATINRGKIVSMINNKPLVRLQMKNPCDHLFMKTIFQSVFNITQNCLFMKSYQVLNVDIDEVAKKYYGGMFLYGNITFKSIFYNDECNFSCTVAEVSLSPKKKKQTK